MLNEHAGSIEDIDEIRIRIIEAIDRPIDELSIRDICARAHISKQTFYSRFSSKYDIANWFCARFEERTLNQIGRTLTWEEGVLAHFKTIAQQKEFLARTSLNGGKDRGEATKARRRRAIVETLTQCRGVTLNMRFRFLIEAYLEMEVFLCGEWFRSGFTPAPEEFSSYYIGCVPGELYDLLELPKDERAICESENEPFARFYV